METMIESLQEFQLAYGHLIRPLIAGTLVSIVCSVVGCFIILRGMSFLADAIAHSMLAGVIAGYLIMKMIFGNQAPHLVAMMTGAMLAGVVTVAMVGLVTRFSRIKQDTAIGIMYTGIFALGAFVISISYFRRWIHIDIYHYIVGSVLAVPDEELWLLALVTSIVLSVVILFYRPLQLTSFDPIMAASIGIPVLAVEYLLTACTSLVVVSGVQIAGVILVVALIITPAATAYLISDRLDRMILLSMLIGVVGFWLGFALAAWVGASPGPAVVVAMTLIFMTTMVLAPRYGLLADVLRRHRAIPQEIMEDILGAVLRARGKLVSVQEIVNNVETPSAKIHRAITLLVRQDLLEQNNGSVHLTDEGRQEANRLVRAHRLWETYLEQTGTPQTELHQKAHQLEHISDQATVEYLDDKLGHPIRDPHGTIIPAATDQQSTTVSLLREGNRGVIQQLLPDVKIDTQLSPGTTVTMGPRSADGKVWVIQTDAGQTFELDHLQADAIVIKLIKT